MSGLRVDLRVPVGRPLPELAEFAARAEAAGLDGIGVPDHHHTGRDAYLVLAAMASRTERLSLFPATSNVVTRHPLVSAALANSLDELAPGRAMLTVAPGFLSVEKAGEPQARRARLREIVLALRGLLGEGHASLDGHELELFHRPATGSRVVVLASGPKLLELAGEVADGVMMLVGLDPAGVEAARKHVRIGAERAGRDPAELEEILIVPFGLGDTATVRAWPRGWFRPGQPWLRYPSASNLTWLRYAGIDVPDGPPEELSDDLTDRILDAYGLFGTPEQCADRLLRAHEELGTTRVFLFPAHSWDTTYELPRAEVDAFGSTIGPALRAAGLSTAGA
ncbi:5,10-methylenetetrahydromethanopterin reductase [Kribbella amoyensis]|uniref:5,10-methylenetetrahydromethanopterin reductase n=1 Tax=Kribbella amoyensis TaxID=996641 RepID=A0A561BM48_9ACTN|nr:LLM class flavin-dependent oxidoreductase [Kribbella amoyensis]TWD79951.1 5,10-methylenetetrahydromethanopterin reductase [Kribbella amoyensis]